MKLMTASTFSNTSKEVLLKSSLSKAYTITATATVVVRLITLISLNGSDCGGASRRLLSTSYASAASDGPGPASDGNTSSTSAPAAVDTAYEFSTSPDNILSEYRAMEREIRRLEKQDPTFRNEESEDGILTESITTISNYEQNLQEIEKLAQQLAAKQLEIEKATAESRGPESITALHAQLNTIQKQLDEKNMITSSYKSHELEFTRLSLEHELALREKKSLANNPKMQFEFLQQMVQLKREEGTNDKLLCQWAITQDFCEAQIKGFWGLQAEEDLLDVFKNCRTKALQRFGQFFKEKYPLAVKLWEVAGRVIDGSKVIQVSQPETSLSSRLSKRVQGLYYSTNNIHQAGMVYRQITTGHPCEYYAIDIGECQLGEHTLKSNPNPRFPIMRSIFNPTIVYQHNQTIRLKNEVLFFKKCGKKRYRSHGDFQKSRNPAWCRMVKSKEGPKVVLRKIEAAIEVSSLELL